MSISDSMISSQYLMDEVHRHQLIKNEDYHAREDDLCYGCGLLINKSSVVYHCIYFSTSAQEDDCAHLFLHKNCAYLPVRYMHPSHKEHTLSISVRLPSFLVPRGDNCDICGIKLKWFTYWCSRHKCNFQVCVACVIPIYNVNIHPPYHCHKLALSMRLATFQCDACQTVESDFSYMCYTCPFWIHLKCSNLPPLLAADIHHKHPLILAYSLPESYRKFAQFCKICIKQLAPSDWLYYCPNCRFFVDIKCATSPPQRWIYEHPLNESDFVHLPVPEYESLLNQCIKKGFISWSEDAAKTPLDHNNHWSHEHQLLLKNKSVPSNTDEEGISPICNGCTESISPNDDVFYECRECDYILHTYCAQFPKEIQHVLGGKYVGIQPTVHDIWSCNRCEVFRNGTKIRSTYETWEKIINVKLDSGCAVLPDKIKHEAHPHLLTLFCSYNPIACSACHKTVSLSDALYKCNAVACYFFIHIKCALKPLRLIHRWDRHPLHLISSPEEVADHPHEFHCELCSEEIDTNDWFYHCSVCDLSFHFGECIDLFFRYSKIKFGATNIKIEAHQHGFTFILNKKRQPCQRCYKNTYGEPVLECAPCKFIQHAQPDLCSIALDV